MKEAGNIMYFCSPVLLSDSLRTLLHNIIHLAVIIVIILLRSAQSAKFSRNRLRTITRTGQRAQGTSIASLVSFVSLSLQYYYVSVLFGGIKQPFFRRGLGQRQPPLFSATLKCTVLFFDWIPNDANTVILAGGFSCFVWLNEDLPRK